MKIDKKCPKCGNRDTKKDIKIRSSFPMVIASCPKCKNEWEIQDKIGEVAERSFENKNWQAYCKKYGVRSGEAIWMHYLWTENSNKELILDTSIENMQRCVDLHQKNQEDKNTLYRLIILKVALGADSDDLRQKLLRSIDKSFVYDFAEEVLRKDRGFNAVKPYFQHMKKFWLWVIENSPQYFKCSDWTDLATIVPFCRLVGSRAIFKLVNIGSILESKNWGFGYISQDEMSLLENLGMEEPFVDSDECKGDILIYALSEFCYFEGNWFAAFRSYSEIIRLSEREGLTDNRKVCYEYDTDGPLTKYRKKVKGYFSDIFQKVKTLADVKERAIECLEKAIRSGEGEKVYAFLNKLKGDKEFFEESFYRKEKESESYLMFFSIIQKVVKRNYDQAYNQWKNLKDKKEIKFIGFKKKSFEEYLKNLKEGKGNKKDNLSGIFKNSLAEDYVLIYDFETKLREFIQTNLKKCYRTKKDAWFYGVPEKIRCDAVRKQQQQRLDDSKKWTLLEFSDYPEIIKGNSKIFRPFFIVDKADNQKKQEELFGFLDRIVPLRNNIMHNRILPGRERSELKNYCSHFDKIYTNWQKSFKKRK